MSKALPSVTVTESYTVLIVDDHPLYGEALLGLVESTFGNVCAVLINSAEEGLRIAKTIKNLKLVILDMGLPGLCGAQAISAFKMLDQKVPIVAISASADRKDASAAFHAGAHTFVSKAAPVNDLTIAISSSFNQVVSKTIWYGPLGDYQLESSLPCLTTRQREILSLICKGYSNKEIALRLDIAEVTVKLHISAIFRSLGVKNRTQAVLASSKLSNENAFV